MEFYKRDIDFVEKVRSRASISFGKKYFVKANRREYDNDSVNIYLTLNSDDHSDLNVKLFDVLIYFPEEGLNPRFYCDDVSSKCFTLGFNKCNDTPGVLGKTRIIKCVPDFCGTFIVGLIHFYKGQWRPVRWRGKWSKSFNLHLPIWNAVSNEDPKKK